MYYIKPIDYIIDVAHRIFQATGLANILIRLNLLNLIASSLLFITDFKWHRCLIFLIYAAVYYALLIYLDLNNKEFLFYSSGLIGGLIALVYLFNLFLVFQAA